MAFLKYYYPEEFFCVLLSNNLNNVDKIIDYTSQLKKHNIKVLPPNINYP
jgi:DNA polymerase III alpha subunit